MIDLNINVMYPFILKRNAKVQPSFHYWMLIIICQIICFITIFIYLIYIYIFKSILIFIFCYTHIKAGPSLVMPVPICLFTICCRLNAVSHRLASSDELSADKPISVWLPPGWGNRNMCQVLPPIMFWGKVQFHVFAFCYFWADPVLWARRRAKIVSWWRDRARVRDEIRHTSGWFQLRPAIVIRISHVFKCLPHCH